MNRDGPTTITRTETTCGLCRFLSRAMVRSGVYPIYDFGCTHPKAGEGGGRYSLPLLSDVRGRYIGHQDNPPEWCPFKTGKA